ncbi:MAG: 23S rRNA (adenine(2503)-C(2))-methyltransferase RlmN [Candidatus Omnitrophica bacterium]|nr:23S rRNA (adenine(2503)-C(2))-methyltransferase RlmN [Candidatus Omnitrophota bacterium]
MKQEIKNLTLEEIAQFLTSSGEKPYHAQQIALWIYKKDVSNFGEMTDLSLKLREKLKENFVIQDIRLIAEKVSEIDATRKFLFQLADGQKIEAVLIPSINRFTACLSTQIGCKFGCIFCASGREGFVRNLEPGEMVNQLQFMIRNLNLLKQRVNNVVFMGMGEPLDNYDNLIKAIKIINHPYALNIGARKITISTCGLADKILRLAQENIQVELSVSLHAPNDKLRSALMPVNQKYPLKSLISACQKYFLSTKRLVTFEYLLIKDVNDTQRNLRELRELLKGFKGKVNLIIYNPFKGINFEPSSIERAIVFQKVLKTAGIITTIRQSKGRDIEAACGQLLLKRENG